MTALAPATPGWSAALVTPVAARRCRSCRAVWRRWRDLIAERVDSGLRRGVSRFGRHYRRYMLTPFRYVVLKSLFVVGRLPGWVRAAIAVGGHPRRHPGGVEARPSTPAGDARPPPMWTVPRTSGPNACDDRRSGFAGRRAIVLATDRRNG